MRGLQGRDGEVEGNASDALPQRIVDLISYSLQGCVEAGGHSSLGGEGVGGFGEILKLEDDRLGIAVG